MPLFFAATIEFGMASAGCIAQLSETRIDFLQVFAILLSTEAQGMAFDNYVYKKIVQK